MEPIQVDAILLRGLLPDLRLGVGTVLSGRVLERHQAHGLLSLGGAVLVAELPAEVQAGERLKLAVQEVTADKVVMRVVADDQAAPQPPPAAVASPVVPLPLPGGAHARVHVASRDDGAGAEDEPGAKAVTLHYDSPALGRVELRLVLGESGLHAGVRAAAGPPAELASGRAGELRAALAEALGRPVEVHVGARRDQVDVRA